MKKFDVDILLGIILSIFLVGSVYAYGIPEQEVVNKKDCPKENYLQDFMEINSIIEKEFTILPKNLIFKKEESIQEKYTEKIFYPLTDSERSLVLNIVCGEAGNQSYEGKVAVASCILNACLRENVGPSVIQTMYGYSGWKDIKDFEAECLEAYNNTLLSDEVYEAVEQVFDRGEIYNSNIFWFYDPSACYSSFHESMNYITTIGNHKFFGRWE